MKTNFRTLAAICILGFIGTINVNATNYRNANNNVVVEELKNAKSELGKADGSLAASTEKTSLESNANAETIQFNLNDVDAKIDLQKEAQLVTKWVVDQEEAKMVKKLAGEGKYGQVESIPSPLNETSEAWIDYQKEAQLATKWVVDQVEAKVVKQLINEGKLMEVN